MKRAGGSKLSGTGERPITPLRLYSLHPEAPRYGWFGRPGVAGRGRPVRGDAQERGGEPSFFC